MEHQRSPPSIRQKLDQVNRICLLDNSSALTVADRIMANKEVRTLENVGYKKPLVSLSSSSKKIIRIIVFSIKLTTYLYSDFLKIRFISSPRFKP